MQFQSDAVTIPYFGSKWTPNPKQVAIHQKIEEFEQQFPVAYVGVCGASRSSKTILLLNEVVDHMLRFPGYSAILSRWTDEATQTIIRPAFYDLVNTHYHPEILATHMPNNGWVAKEERQFFSNGSYIYLKGLKSGDDVNRYAKFDGLGLHAIFISQAEELPKDVFERLYTRLSAKGYPRLFLFEMNPVLQEHYIFREYEERDDYDPPMDHAFFHASVYDNAENLPEGYIDSLERAYPPGHPLRHRLIEGKWGMSAKGTPIVGSDRFNYELHVNERLAKFDPRWPLIMSYDPGFTHPSLTWSQMDRWGRERVLDSVIGTDVHADEFFWEAARRQKDTFGEVPAVLACADKASEHRHGNSTKTEWDIFREHLRPWRVTPLTGVVASKMFLIQRLLARFSQLIHGEPAIVFHPRCEYLIEGMAGGWVWRAPTTLRPTPGVPLDSYYAHGADTLLYIEMHFGPGIRKVSKVDDRYDPGEHPRSTRRRATSAGY